MVPITRIALYSDVHCPSAYLTAYRLRKLRDEYRGSMMIEYKSLALEYVNQRPTPKEVLDNEPPLLMLEEKASGIARGTERVGTLEGRGKPYLRPPFRQTGQLPGVAHCET